MLGFFVSVAEPAVVMWFERVELFGTALERFVIYPLLFATALTCHAGAIFTKFGLG